MNNDNSQSFNNADDEPRSKRQRTSLACNSCRTRKTRCNGARPCCSACADMDFTCIYQHPARTSAASNDETSNMSRFNDRLLALETLLQTLARKSDTSEASIHSLPTPMAEQSRLSTVEQHFGDAEDGSPQFADTIRAQEFGQQSTILAEPVLHEDTVDGMGSITFSDERASGHFGPTSNSAFFRYIARALSNGDKTELQHAQAPTVNQASLERISRPVSPERLFPRFQRERQRLHLPPDGYRLPPKAEITQLVHHFFASFGRNMFPYIDERSVLGTLASMDFSNVHGLRPSWLCLLNTIMAFATSMADIGTNVSNPKSTKSDIFLGRALHMLSDMQSRPANLEMLQAMLLATQCLQATQRSGQTWNLQRLSVQIAYHIGVHSSANSANFTPLEQEIRKRSWYMCFVVDKICSMTYGRPLSIHNRDTRLDLPLDVGLEDLDQSTGDRTRTPSEHNPSTVVLYIQTIKLYQILGDVINEVYENNTESDTPMSNSDLIVLRVLPIEKKLSTWKSELPPNLQVNNQSQLFGLGVSSISSRLNAVITLRYLNTRILLHRSILQRFLDYDSRKASNDEDWKFLQRFGKSSLEVCIETASEMIDIIYSFSEFRDQIMTTWWFLVFYSFSSALVVFGAMVALPANNIVLPNYQHHNLLESLHKALRNLAQFGNGTRIATRCQKYLEKFIQFAVVTARDQTSSLNAAIDSGLLNTFQPVLDINSLDPNLDWGNFFPPMEPQFSDTMSYTF